MAEFVPLIIGVAVEEQSFILKISKTVSIYAF